MAHSTESDLFTAVARILSEHRDRGTLFKSERGGDGGMSLRLQVDVRGERTCYELIEHPDGRVDYRAVPC